METADELARRVRADFPLLAQKLVFLDAASTTPKPRAVIDAVRAYYETSTGNVHRGVHPLGEAATRAYEAARLEVASFVGASPSEIVFVRGTTEAINLLANGLRLGPEDEVIVPASEHHSNFLPWRFGARAVVAPIDAEGVPRWEAIEKLFSPRTKLLAFAHVSNVTGAVAPVAELARRAHARGVPVLLDAAQSLAHLPIDARALGVDFLAASSHKAFGPTGAGFLHARRDRLARLALHQVGGGMGGGLVPLDPPYRFEAGTPAIEAAIGFGAAVRWLRELGWEAVTAHERALAARMHAGLAEIRGLRVLGARAPERLPIASFVVDAPEKFARALADEAGICVSAGEHCAHELHARLGLAGTVRASASVYNDFADVDAFLRAVNACGAGGGSR